VFAVEPVIINDLFFSFLYSVVSPFHTKFLENLTVCECFSCVPLLCILFYLVLCCCCLDDGKGIWPVKNELSSSLEENVMWIISRKLAGLNQSRM